MYTKLSTDFSNRVLYEDTIYLPYSSLADKLSIRDINAPFHIIECSGVSILVF